MSVVNVVLGLLGLAMLVAGLWWIGGGRWRWLPRVRARRVTGLSEPTRMVVGLAHLILGYHLVVWSVPLRETRPIQLPRQNWYWLVLGCAGAMAGSFGLDRLSPLERDQSDDEQA